eukprot:1162018-Pelagomonas_calceolata.AAC.19
MVMLEQAYNLQCMGSQPTWRYTSSAAAPSFSSSANSFKVLALKQRTCQRREGSRATGAEKMVSACDRAPCVPLGLSMHFCCCALLAFSNAFTVPCSTPSQASAASQAM